MVDDTAKAALAIAIDGPVASGKTTVGRITADRLGYAFLDTGLMYRAATWQAIRAGVDVSDGDALTRMVAATPIELTYDADGRQRVMVGGVDATDELRTTEVERNVSAVSSVAGVRRALIPKQRNAAIAVDGRMVMVGRDICAKVLPDARVKVYLNASDEVRARRRYDETVASGTPADFEAVLEAVRRRDRLDSEIADSLLKLVKNRENIEGVEVVETDGLGVDEVVDRVVERM